MAMTTMTVGMIRRKRWTIIYISLLVHSLFLLSSDLSSSSSFFASAAPAPASTSTSITTNTGENPLHEFMEARRKRVSRTLKSWRIRRAAEKPKSRLLITNTPNNKKKNPNSRGFMFTFHKPTKERISQWFGIDEDSNEVQLGMLQKGFNHDMVGMTNPYLRHIQSSCSSTTTTTKDVDCTIPVSTKTTTTTTTRQNQSSSSWWPSIINPPQHEKKKKKKKQWRILTYRDNVGNGVDCYNRVKEAILDWEFHNSDQSTGLINVPPSATKRVPQQPMSPQARYMSQRRYSVSPDPTDDDASDSSTSSSMSFHRTIGSARRMVSFASSRLLPFLPPIYAINPVMVVYDLVDQRGPGTTFTSTAYATMKGHLLKGEERVTVALRDDYDQSVDVEIISISRPANTPIANGLWPFIGRKQNNFFELQMDFLKGVGGRKATTHSTSMDFLKGIGGKEQKSKGGNSNNKYNKEDNNMNNYKSKLSTTKFPVTGFDDHSSHFESHNRLGKDFEF